MPCKTCGKETAQDAAFCPHCGTSLKAAKKPDSVSPLTAIIVLAFTGFMIWLFISASPSTTPDGRYIQPAPIGAKPPVVTMAEYNKIAEGMTYEQVKAIIGAPGQELSRTELGGFTTVMYQWVNPGGSNMNCMIQNGGLVSKAQFGLE